MLNIYRKRVQKRDISKDLDNFWFSNIAFPFPTTYLHTALPVYQVYLCKRFSRFEEASSSFLGWKRNRGIGKLSNIWLFVNVVKRASFRFTHLFLINFPLINYFKMFGIVMNGKEMDYCVTSTTNSEPTVNKLQKVTVELMLENLLFLDLDFYTWSTLLYSVQYICLSYTRCQRSM